ncbi:MULTISPECIES: CvpA family protein [unclassified Methylophaga]|jgi:membrane protein required for colicin V production|nr:MULTISPECIES: CvpA family protein [unclassified Methylophaga]MAL48780.1 colicin V production CvpA [Methylophaga sp.]MAP25671.1 colicin V production CvpA [Methylophaga sp.]MBP25030.1 colicin V production CvpA [Methylophaga sp.]HAD30035.1 colicin V production CvpA [Methylophaga sp.]HCC81542.1 colicin V production CvpA [Methylophaga sp.]|tara:strand:- start:2401 stop:2892 length:492 start_codon:yes stop_codon:yes gene_type:complete
MNWVDYLIIGIILISSGISIVRGFIKEVLSLISWIVAIWVAFMFFANFASLLTPYIDTATLRLFIAFFVLFVVTLILGALVNHLISQLVEKTGLSGTDRALGVIFGILRGAAIVTILVLAAGVTPMPSDSWWQNSLLLQHFEDLAIWVKQFLPADVAEHVNFN